MKTKTKNIKSWFISIVLVSVAAAIIWALVIRLEGEKPVVTGAFTIESFELMKNLQLAVRGSTEALREKPLTIFSCQITLM